MYILSVVGVRCCKWGLEGAEEILTLEYHVGEMGEGGQEVWLTANLLMCEEYMGYGL